MTDAPERMLVLIKPDAVRRRLTGEILRRIEAKGYEIVALDRLVATPDVLAEHYAEHVDKPFYPASAPPSRPLRPRGPSAAIWAATGAARP